MDKNKISKDEINSNNVKSAADHVHDDNVQNNKNIFDKLPELIVERFNGFVDAVIAKFAGYYNKTEVDEKIGEKLVEIGAGDMQKSIYDTNGDGVVDNAEKLDGHEADYFATSEAVETAQLTADGAMPKSGGAFTGAVKAMGDTTSGPYIRNTRVTSKEGTAVTYNVATNNIVFQRK